MPSKKSWKKWIDTPWIRLIQELLLQAKTKEDMQEVLEFLKELWEEDEDLEEEKNKTIDDNTENQELAINNFSEWYYIAIVEWSYWWDGTPWWYWGIRKFVFINNTNKSVIIWIETTWHLTTDDWVVDLVTDETELKKKIKPYSYVSLDSMDWEGYIEYNAAIVVNVEKKSYYINQRSLIRSGIKLEENFKDSLNTIPIVNKPWLIYNIDEFLSDKIVDDTQY